MASQKGAPSSSPLPPPPPPSPPSALARVSTVDCSSPGAPQAIRDALKELGCFYAMGLGVRRSTIAALLSGSRAFFSLPLETKMRIKSDSNFRGYTPMNDERLGGDPAGDFKEGVYFGRDITDKGDPLFDLPLHGPNQWPSDADVPGYKEAVESSFEEFRAASSVLLRLVARALEVKDDFFVRKFFEGEEEEGKREGEGNGAREAAKGDERDGHEGEKRRRCLAMDFIRTLHYAPMVSNPETGKLGCGAHCDYGFVTLLVTDGVPGLQILDESQQQWCLVPAAAPWPPANDLGTSRPAPLSASVLAGNEASTADDDSEFPVFVNAGDMLHRWSNGFFRSALHRVSLSESRDRYSAAFFFDPPWSCQVEPLVASSSDPDSNDKAHSLFPPTTYGEYLVAKFRETHESFEAAAGEEVEKRKKRAEEGAETMATKN